MFPWNYGFRLDTGHIIFLGLFYTVLLVILNTLRVAVSRTLRDYRKRRTAAIAWHTNFEDLPPAERACRHSFTGELPGRVCPQGFDCAHCERHAALVAHNGPQLMPGVNDDSLGIVIPLDRYYHRGHTWARPERDGTFTIGLDELARRVAPHPEAVELPAPGTHLAAQATAWTLRVHGSEIHVKAPFDAEVVETAHGERGWFLRVKPAPKAVFTHLLRGPEVTRWLMRELERVQLLVSGSATLPALADGGVPVDDFAAACPHSDWRNIAATVFLGS